MSRMESFRKKIKKENLESQIRPEWAHCRWRWSWGFKITFNYELFQSLFFVQCLPLPHLLLSLVERALFVCALGLPHSILPTLGGWLSPLPFPSTPSRSDVSMGFCLGSLGPPLNPRGPLPGLGRGDGPTGRGPWQGSPGQAGVGCRKLWPAQQGLFPQTRVIYYVVIIKPTGVGRMEGQGRCLLCEITRTCSACHAGGALPGLFSCLAHSASHPARPSISLPLTPSLIFPSASVFPRATSPELCCSQGSISCPAHGVVRDYLHTRTACVFSASSPSPALLFLFRCPRSLLSLFSPPSPSSQLPPSVSPQIQSFRGRDSRGCSLVTRPLPIVVSVLVGHSN